MRILEIASDAITKMPPPANYAWEALSALLSGKRGSELLNLLVRRNGFYAFESALLVRPLDDHIAPLSLIQWNDPKIWKSHFEFALNDVIFFAEDIFGGQFCIKNEKITSFDPETAEFTVVADTLDEWTEWIMQDSKLRTGWPFAHFWQLRHGPLKLGMRLLPKVPFVLGGQFDLENFYNLNEVEGMRYRASIANQLRECPDGSSVVLRILDDKATDSNE